MRLHIIFYPFSGIHLSVFLILLAQMSFAQDITFKVKKSTPKKYILVYEKNRRGANFTKAFRVVDNAVQIDSNYDEIGGLFTIDSTVKMKSNILFSEIKSLRKTELVRLEKYLKNVVRCDSTYPYMIQIVDGEKKETFELAAYGKYCTATSKNQLLNDLDDYFSP